MTDISGVGVTVSLPAGWEGRIRGLAPAVAAGEISTASEDESTALLQVATVPIPPDAGDYGGGIVQTLTSRDVFMVLGEYGAESVGQPLFAAQGMPRLRPADASPDTLRLMLAGQSGIQRFFTVSGRAFGLYVVLGSHRRRIGLVGLVNDILASVRIE